MKKTKQPKRDLKQELVDRVVKMMEMSAEYETPWFPHGGRPHNPVTGTLYRGINTLSLMMAGYADNRFYTFKNIVELDKKARATNPEAQIALRKGETGTPIFKAKRIIIKKGEDEPEIEGDPALNQEGRAIMVMMPAGFVFNAEQIEGLPAETPKNTDFDPCVKAEFLIEAMCQETGLKFRHFNGVGAKYSPSEDQVTVPEKSAFKSSPLYYRTTLHELGHSTGHPSRLNRQQASRVANMQAYAFEELIAEISSYFMEHEIGIPYDRTVHKNHAAYLQGWIEGLKQDKNVLFKACAAASKSADYQVRIAREHRAKLMEEFGVGSLPDFSEIRQLNSEDQSSEEEDFSIDDATHHNDLDATPALSM